MMSFVKRCVTPPLPSHSCLPLPPPSSPLPPSDFMDLDGPPQTLLNIGSRDRDKGTFDVPRDYVSYRVTTDSLDLVTDIFKGCCCVIADEVSKQGVRHFHVVVAGHEMFEVVKKRLCRAKLGKAKYWSAKNHRDDFLAAVSYTVKCGDYYTRKGFHRFVDLAPEWKFGQVYHVPSDVKDTDKDWMLTYNNLLRVCMNWRAKHDLKTKNLGDVLAHMSEHSRWIPSPQMIKTGLDPLYHRMFAYRVRDAGSFEKPPAWWEPRVEAFGVYK